MKILSGQTIKNIHNTNPKTIKTLNLLESNKFSSHKSLKDQTKRAKIKKMSNQTPTMKEHKLNFKYNKNKKTQKY